MWIDDIYLTFSSNGTTFAIGAIVDWSKSGKNNNNEKLESSIDYNIQSMLKNDFDFVVYCSLVWGLRRLEEIEHEILNQWMEEEKNAFYKWAKPIISCLISNDHVIKIISICVHLTKCALEQEPSDGSNDVSSPLCRVSFFLFLCSFLF